MKVTEKIKEELEHIVGPENVMINEEMKFHTTMKVGGAAAYYVSPAKEQEITAVIDLLKDNGIPFYILGNGSNVIFRDEGFDGAVICLADRFKGYRIIKEDPDEVLAAVKAGTQNKDFSDEMIRRGLSGFEFASGIPGSTGGAAIMNAGAYDGEISNIVRQIRLLDNEGNIMVISKEEMNYGYRYSMAGDKGYIVLETVFALRPDTPEAVKDRVDQLTRRREEKQPLEFPSCGSTFKRPEGYFAGKLITDSGMRGYRLGGALVSEKHAGFIVNADNATAAQIIELIDLVKKKVLETQGVVLECEVKII